jgi:hypothetical protein
MGSLPHQEQLDEAIDWIFAELLGEVPEENEDE